MFAFRLVAGSALAVLFAASPTPALKLATVKPHQHHHFLQAAFTDLKAAEASVAAGNAGKAHQLVAAAVGQIEQAIHHHHTNHLTVTRTGLTGALRTALHHQHHGHLHRALADCRAAEKQLRSGTAVKAIKDIEAAERQVAAAIQSHHHVIR